LIFIGLILLAFVVFGKKPCGPEPPQAARDGQHQRRWGQLGVYAPDRRASRSWRRNRSISSSSSSFVRRRPRVTDENQRRVASVGTTRELLVDGFPVIDAPSGLVGKLGARRTSARARTAPPPGMLGGGAS
jgi:hypothetical protein